MMMMVTMIVNINEHLVHVIYCSKYFACINSYNSFKPMKLVVVSSPFYRWENWVTKRLNNLLRVTQLLNSSFNKHISCSWMNCHITSRRYKNFQMCFMSNFRLWFILTRHCCLIYKLSMNETNYNLRRIYIQLRKEILGVDESNWVTVGNLQIPYGLTQAYLRHRKEGFLKPR